DAVGDVARAGLEAGVDLAGAVVQRGEPVVTAHARDGVELAAHVHPAAGDGERLDLVVGGGLPGAVEGAGAEVERGQGGAGLAVHAGDGATEVEAAVAGGERVRLAADAVLERAVQR